MFPFRRAGRMLAESRAGFMRRLRLTPAGVGSGARVLGKPDSELEVELRGAGTGSLADARNSALEGEMLSRRIRRGRRGDSHAPPAQCASSCAIELNARDRARAGLRS